MYTYQCDANWHCQSPDRAVRLSGFEVDYRSAKPSGGPETHALQRVWQVTKYRFGAMIFPGFTMLTGTPTSIAVAPVDWGRRSRLSWRRVIVTRAALLLTL